MRSLDCQAGKCGHNCDGKCTANTIEISNNATQTFCNTYVDQDKYPGDAKAEMNAFKLEAGAEAFVSPKILCNVDECIHNKSSHCKANGVQIDNSKANDVFNCVTYKHQ